MSWLSKKKQADMSEEAKKPKSDTNVWTVTAKITVRADQPDEARAMVEDALQGDYFANIPGLFDTLIEAKTVGVTDGLDD